MKIKKNYQENYSSLRIKRDTLTILRKNRGSRSWDRFILDMIANLENGNNQALVSVCNEIEEKLKNILNKYRENQETKQD